MNRIRIRNRVLQFLYRPRRGRFLSAGLLAELNEIDKSIEEAITPLLSDFFG